MTKTIAPLRNVTLFSELAERVLACPAHLHPLGTFHGFSGYGKTFAATYAAHHHKAIYVEVGSTWTKRKLCQALCGELGRPATGTITDMMDEIIMALAVDQRLLILDEFDYVVQRAGMLDMVREILDKSLAPVIIIGEEMLPAKLKKHERFHNRVLCWTPAQPATAPDVAHLARLYAPEITVQGDLLDRIAEAAAGRARRACVSIERVREFAATKGLDAVGLADWGDQPIYLGAPATRRS
ncbi:MAG: AAA family ATPase [Desulfovibrionaceae bacterium]